MDAQDSCIKTFCYDELCKELDLQPGSQIKNVKLLSQRFMIHRIVHNFGCFGDVLHILNVRCRM